MKRIVVIMIIAVMMIATACGGNSGAAGDTKTVTSKEEVKELAEAFYAPLKEADNYKMSSYFNDELISILTKDQDKMHVEYTDEEYGYDYFLFMQDGKKYVITDDRSLFEDEATYDLSADNINMTLDMGIFAYLDADIEGMSYSATMTGDSELVTTIQGESEGSKFTFTTTGKKENNEIVELISEIKSEEETYVTKYQFTYGEHVDLPEYTVPKSYDNLPHVDSPYETFGEIIEKIGEDGYLNYYFFDNQLIVIDEKDGRHYQLSSNVDQDIVDQYNELDFMSDDYEKQVNELISGIKIDDCIDFTDELLSQEDFETYIGSTISKMTDDGFEIMGYGFMEDDNTIFVSKDYMSYRVNVELPDGVDPNGEFEYDEFGEFLITGVEFDNVESAALPMS